MSRRWTRCEALFSAAAAGTPGVTLEDPFYPLRGATTACRFARAAR